MNRPSALRQDSHLQRFTQLTQLTQLKQHPIQGVPLVSSDSEDTEQPDLALIKRKLQLFKEEKAREVANQHLKTRESIERIIDRSRDQLQYEALCIIKPHIASSVESKPVKEMGSTLPSSTNSKNHIETPGFELGSEKEITIDLREFTLGQKEASSNRSIKEQRLSQWEVSDFHAREPSSKRIKDRIINNLNRRT